MKRSKAPHQPSGAHYEVGFPSQQANAAAHIPQESRRCRSAGPKEFFAEPGLPVSFVRAFRKHSSCPFNHSDVLGGAFSDPIGQKADAKARCGCFGPPRGGSRTRARTIEVDGISAPRVALHDAIILARRYDRGVGQGTGEGPAHPQCEIHARRSASERPVRLRAPGCTPPCWDREHDRAKRQRARPCS